AIRAAQGNLELAGGPVAIEHLHLVDPLLDVDKESHGAVLPELLPGFHPHHLEKRSVAMEQAAVARRDVDSLAQVLGEFAKTFRIAQASKAGRGLERGRRTHFRLLCGRRARYG